MQQRTYKDKLILLNLTRVSLKLNTQLTISAELHIRDQTHVIEFDLSLTKIIHPRLNTIHKRMCKVKLNYVSLP